MLADTMEKLCVPHVYL